MTDSGTIDMASTFLSVSVGTVDSGETPPALPPGPEPSSLSCTCTA